MLRTSKTQKCISCWTSFEITEDDLNFYKKISPVINWKKYDLPIPKICPECRQQQRCCFRNRRNLYKRKCNLTGKNIISMYSPDKPYKVYNNNDYESKIDTIEHGRDFDFSISFFEQIKKLQLEAPRFHAAVVTKTMENADYVNWAHWVTNWYLSFSVTECEDVYYCEWIYNSKLCFDCYHVYSCEMCYNCVESSKLYRCICCYYSNEWTNLYFCSNCEWCKDCFGCVNLVNKQYCIKNKQYTKKEYERITSSYEYTQENINIFEKELFDLQKQHPLKATRTINAHNSVWDDLINTKNCFNCFGSENDEDMRHCFFINDSRNCMDLLYFGSNLDRSYWSVSVWMNSNNLYFCLECYDSVSNLLYCDNCSNNTKNCFGCVWLRNKEYCILNKQYTKQEYESLVPQIIEHMQDTWERWYFFPPSYSTFWYNESLANQHFHINSKEEALSKWYNWIDKEYNIDIPEWIHILETKDISNDIYQIKDDILEKAIKCKETIKPFRIIKKELEYYRKIWIWIPHLHPNQRHKNRFNRVNKKKILIRNCDKCWTIINTTYNSNSGQKIYCENCYNKEIY